MHWNDQIIVFQSRPMYALLHPDYCFTIRTQWILTYVPYKWRQKWHLFQSLPLLLLYAVQWWWWEGERKRARLMSLETNSRMCLDLHKIFEIVVNFSFAIWSSFAIWLKLSKNLIGIYMQRAAAAAVSEAFASINMTNGNQMHTVKSVKFHLSNNWIH